MRQTSLRKCLTRGGAWITWRWDGGGRWEALPGKCSHLVYSV